MIMPVNKMCPLTRGERPCLGELCAWFDVAAAACVVAAKLVKEAPKPKSSGRVKVEQAQ